MNKKSNNSIQISLIVFLFLLVSPQSFPQLANGYDKFLGNVHSGNPPSSWDNYWNQVTPENAGKWGSVEGTRDVYSWGGADNAYNYAKQRGIPFKWHTLIWGQQAPGWISALSTAEQLEEIVELFSAVGQRYPEIDYIDVVNEALNGHNPPDGGNGRANFKASLGGNGTTGWDWVIKAFELARQYMPNSKLILNDYGIINDNNATTSYLTIINLLKQRGLIDGIGVQGHRFELMNASSSTLQSNMDRLWGTGIQIYISELDLGPDENSQPNEALQLSAYQRIFPLLWEHPGLKCITLWGYVQGQMWQPNCYLLRSNGSETPALEWLRQYLTKSGTYRTFQSGNWNDVNSWEQYDDSVWIHPVPEVPSLGSEVITIQNGHTITVTQQDSADQVIVATGGTLVINPGVNFLVKNGTSTDLTVNGTLKNFGTISKDDSAVIVFAGGGKYQHEQDGGAIPTTTWRQNSTVQFDSLKTTAPSNANQDFNNVVWNCPSQTENLNIGWNGNTISGNITVTSTGTGRWQMCAPAENTSAAVTINGDIIQAGGNFTTNGTGNAGTTITINHGGDINVTGGNFSISRGNQGSTGTTTWNLNGNFSMSNGTTQNSNAAGAKFVFTGTATHNLVLGSGNTLTALPIEVDSSASLNMGTSELQGSGIFTLQAGATMHTGHPDGLNGNLKNTGTITLNNQASYGFNGTTAQVTGNLMPDQVENLILNNNAGITLSKSVTINGIVDIKKEGFSPGAFQLNYGSEAALSYSGTTAMSTSDIEFPAQDGPKNLIIDNSSSSGITLHAPRTITENLLLSGKFRLGDNNFTAASVERVGAQDYAVTNGAGALTIINVGTTEILFPVGANNYYSPVWITNNGTSDNITVRVEADAQTLPEGGRIRVKWILNDAVAGGGDYTLKFGWVAQLEDTPFRQNRAANAGIFLLGSDTTEAGSGAYTTQFDLSPYSVARGGILSLGTFGVGKFGDISVDIKEEELLPADYSLSQNYPNPFNPSTTIVYSIPIESFVQIRIYDILGREIKTLVDEKKPAGGYTINFEASDLSSGIYLYQLKAGNPESSAGQVFIEQKKMILLK